MKRLSFILLALVATAVAAQPRLSPNAPKDKPASVSTAQMEAFEAAIAPHVAHARSTYPDAKSRFLSGLPQGQHFFVTTRLYDGTGSFERVFIAVESIKGGTVTGRIASNIMRITGYKNGDEHSLEETELLDWLIAHPDGSEEGNFVGKFLDGYRGGA